MMGIYAISNNQNNKKYIGSSVDISHRFYEHKYKLQKNEHDNLHLQNSWNIYGEDAFSFDIIEIVNDPSDLLSSEQIHISRYNFNELYNINPIADKPPLHSHFFNKDGTKTGLYPNIGDNINDLTICSEFIKRGGINFVTCECKCGSIRDYCVYDLIIKNCPKNCGCDKTHMKSWKHGATSGGKGKETPEFKTWKRIIEMCSNPNCKSYSKYGGKGINVSHEWKNSFQKFLDDMGNKPGKSSILGRKNTNGDYNKDNCFWTTLKYQNNNRKDTVYIEYNNVRKSLREWAEEKSINPVTLWNRIKAGWPVERALTEVAKIGKNQYSK